MPYRTRLGSVAGGLAVAAIALGCAAPVPTATPIPPPTAAPAKPAAAGAPGGQGERISGTVQSADGGKITLGDGRAFTLDANTRIIRQESIAPADLKAGMYVAVTATRESDGTLLASMVNIFPEETRGAGIGQRPMSGGALMTNATIDQVEGSNFSVSFPGGGARIRLAPEAKLARLVMGQMGDIHAGMTVSALVNNGVASSVSVQ
ncbi:MAG TPA: DUF5666 domain-containing protein [Chloroflexota bacterium]|jgi:hypothetical protein